MLVYLILILKYTKLRCLNKLTNSTIGLSRIKNSLTNVYDIVEEIDFGTISIEDYPLRDFYITLL